MSFFACRAVLNACLVGGMLRSGYMRVDERLETFMPPRPVASDDRTSYYHVT
jgi:hypothetical protein